MTRHQRAQVVELLRCAADRLLMGGSMADSYADPRSLASARELVHDVAPYWWGVLNKQETAFACLEAAQRVEEGSYP